MPPVDAVVPVAKSLSLGDARGTLTTAYLREETVSELEAEQPTCDEDPEAFAGEPVPDDWASERDGGDTDGRMDAGAQS